MFHEIISGENPMQPFKDLIKFDTFKKMPNLETASYLEKKFYSIERDLDIRTMKRLRAYIELEEELNSKY